MKQILVFILLIIAFPSYAQKQRGYWDYKNGEQVTIDGVTYIIEFKHDKTILEMLDSYLVSIRRIDEPEEQFDKFGEYPDGTFGDDPEECAGIIRRRQEIPQRGAGKPSRSPDLGLPHSGSTGKDRGIIVPRSRFPGICCPA